MARAPLISVVDDDLSVREATAGLLEAHGYLTAAFASGEEFLGSELLKLTSCLVTDVRMPGMSGVEVQQRLRKAGHSTPIIFMTAHPEKHICAAAMKDGARGFLTKPVSEQQLISCLEGALHSLDDLRDGK